MSDSKTVWADGIGDLRKKQDTDTPKLASEKNIVLELRRLTSGKGRAVIEIKGLPANKAWNKDLAKKLKKSLGVGGAYKNDYIEIHGEKLQATKDFLDGIGIKWKQTGG